MRNYSRHTVITTTVVLRMDTQGASPMKRADLYALMSRMDMEVRKAEGLPPNASLPDDAYTVLVCDREIELSYAYDREVRNG